MTTEIKMPQLSDTMSAGKIVQWKKKEGDQLKRGDILAEVETDKANLEIECFHPGVLLKIVVNEGGSAAVGESIAVIGQAGESVNSTNGSSPKPAPAATAPRVEPQAAQPQPAAQSVPQPKPVESPNAENGDRIKASPLAKKLAEDSNVDLSNVKGSGPGGRIIRKDIDAARSGTPTSSSQPAQVAARAETPVSAAPAAGSLTPFSKMRDTIARRMQESVATSPHFYVSCSVDMGEASKLREILKERPQYKGISVNHLIIKAAAYGLSRERAVNCAVKDGQLYSPPGINIGIVTAIPDGLLIPVIKDVDRLSLKDVVFEARAAVERAKAGRPSSSDLSGGTFTISNMGMFDVDSFTAIISPGQGAILAISSTKEVPVVIEGQIKIAKQMNVTLSSDHRIIDGIMAARFLKHFKEALEVPALLGME